MLKQIFTNEQNNERHYLNTKKIEYIKTEFRELTGTTAEYIYQVISEDNSLNYSWVIHHHESIDDWIDLISDIVIHDNLLNHLQNDLFWWWFANLEVECECDTHNWLVEGF